VSFPGEPVLLDLPSEAAVTSVVRAALRALAENRHLVRLSGPELDEVAVVLQEACTNVIRHAHLSDPRRRFQVEIRRQAEALEIVVRDEGRPFDLATVGPPPEPERLEEGGYGVHIIRSWMDEVTVSREGGRNVLRMLRRYRGPSAATGTPEATHAGPR